LNLGYIHDSDIGEFNDIYQMLTWSIIERLTSVGHRWLDNQVEAA
jgi:hypothetical protein